MSCSCIQHNITAGFEPKTARYRVQRSMLRVNMKYPKFGRLVVRIHFTRDLLIWFVEKILDFPKKAT